MKCTIPEISWHNREPVLSIDVHPLNNDFYKLASCGGDCHVLIWQMNLTDNGAVKQEVISDLTRHQRAVNCVRWSPSGTYLASADDDANIIVWQLKTDNIPLLEGETNDKETWIVYKVLRGHKEDIYDLCWSVDSSKLYSGSIDNTAILWDIVKGKMDHILTDHKGFVQGVAWDPKNQVIASISTDRICRIFDPSGKHVKARISKGFLPVPENHYLSGKEVKFFHDDTFKSFFRRLKFTPDGSLLIVPSGCMEIDNCKKTMNATLVFTLDNLSTPAVILPLPRQNSTVVCCCPVLFELWENGPDPVIKLPYRMVFAVGTDHDILLYDTQQSVPFARFQDVHYTRLTDLTWSPDGQLLIASSTDGFCSLITFEPEELGTPYTKEDSEPEESVLDISGIEELEKDENVDVNNKEDKEKKEESKKKNTFLEQWAKQKAAKKSKLNENGVKFKENDGVVEILEDEAMENDEEHSETKTPTEEQGESSKSKPKENGTHDPEKQKSEGKSNVNSIRKWVQPIKMDKVNLKKDGGDIIEILDDKIELDSSKNSKSDAEKAREDPKQNGGGAKKRIQPIKVGDAKPAQDTTGNSEKIISNGIQKETNRNEEGLMQNKPKKRIQPIKVGDVTTGENTGKAEDVQRRSEKKEENTSPNKPIKRVQPIKVGSATKSKQGPNVQKNKFVDIKNWVKPKPTAETVPKKETQNDDVIIISDEARERIEPSTERTTQSEKPKKRIQPIKIGNVTSKLSKEEAKKETENKIDPSPKKRIQPVRVGEVEPFRKKPNVEIVDLVNGETDDEDEKAEAE